MACLCEATFIFLLYFSDASSSDLQLAWAAEAHRHVTLPLRQPLWSLSVLQRRHLFGCCLRGERPLHPCQAQITGARIIWAETDCKEVHPKLCLGNYSASSVLKTFMVVVAIKNSASCVWADAVRGASRFSADQTRNLSIMQTSLNWSGVWWWWWLRPCVAFFWSHSGCAVKHPANWPILLFLFDLRKRKVLCEKYLFFCLSDLWVRHGAVVQQWLPAPGLRGRGHQGGTYSEISCEWPSPLWNYQSLKIMSY